VTTLSLDDLVDRARALPGDRVILGIVGAPGAGKSTLGAQLVERLGPVACLVPMDGYHLAQVQLEAKGIANRKGAPDTFDALGYTAMLRRLASTPGETAYAPFFDRSIEEPIAGAIEVPSSARIIVTEGNYLLLESDGWGGVAELLTESWYVAPDPGLRRSRLVARHIEFGRSPEAAREWVETVDEPNARLIDATAVRADLVISDWH
jgi:pantothenate kinase